MLETKGIPSVTIILSDWYVNVCTEFHVIPSCNVDISLDT